MQHRPTSRHGISNALGAVVGVVIIAIVGIGIVLSSGNLLGGQVKQHLKHPNDLIRDRVN